jgi:hypothetical protein
MKSIVISKTGADHLYAGVNRQDFALDLPNLKLVLDGCGSMQFSEVGVALFGQLLTDECSKREQTGQQPIGPNDFEVVVEEIFCQLTTLFSTDMLKLQNLSFTILACFELENEFVVLSCGDGFVLASKDDCMFELVLDDGEYPKYFVYNLLEDTTALETYREGVQFSSIRLPKSQYDNVGVATDGLRFAKQLTRVDLYNFYDYLRQGRGGKVAMLINRYSGTFKDDISIVF